MKKEHFRMKAVECSVCRLRVLQDEYLGNLTVVIPGNHRAVEQDGFAEPARTAECPGSERLGDVVDVEEVGEVSGVT